MGEQLSPALLSDLRDAFFLFDFDRDGLVTSQELGAIVRSVGLNPTETELGEMVKEVDVGSSGVIDVNGLSRMISKRMRDQREKGDLEMVTTADQLRDAFSVFDKDGDGIVSVNDLRHSLTSLGESIGDEELDELIREVDPDGIGQMKYEDIITILLAK